MTPERYRQIDELVAAALELDASQRKAFLDKEYAGDEYVRQEVNSLIAAHEAAERKDFLGTPTEMRPTEVLASDPPSWPSERPSEMPQISGERYKILRELSEQGNVGVVYLAQDLRLDSRPVVVKVLKEGVRQNPYWRRKIQDEIKALARFQNPHIVGILDQGQLPGGTPFFVMPFVEGVSLRSVMNGTPMKFTRVAAIIRQAGRALSYAHERAVFHRDLKPENILLRTAEDEDFVILIDFGIATVKELRPTTRGTTTAIVGTPLYMAPEQLKGEPSPASDIYALGVISYEMLTGQRPFEPPKNDQWMSHLLQMQEAGVGVMPNELRPGLPEAAQASILKALSFDPRDRHPRARDFGDELAAILVRDRQPPMPITTGAPAPENDQEGSETITITLAESKSPEVVISYCAQDLGRALEVADGLRKAGVACWMSDHGREVNLGDRSETVEAIKQSKVVIVICSDAALRSHLVKQDLQLAWCFERPYLPVVIEPIDFLDQKEYWLEGRRFVDAMGSGPEPWLPVLLRSLARTGVHFSDPEPATSQDAASVEPIRLDCSLQSLRRIARFTDQIWPLSAERRAASRSSLRGLGAPQEDVQHGHRLGSRVCLAIESEHPGNLLLLDEGPDGVIYCLCPSWFAPDTRLHAGRSHLPQMGSRYDSFVVTGKPGREHLLAIVSEEPLGLDWLPGDPRVPARVLKQADVDVLLNRLRGLRGDRWVALSTYFDVVD